VEAKAVRLVLSIPKTATEHKPNALSLTCHPYKVSPCIIVTSLPSFQILQVDNTLECFPLKLCTHCLSHSSEPDVPHTLIVFTTTALLKCLWHWSP